jgi:hypothetical protein
MLTGTATIDSVTNPSDKVQQSTSQAIKPEQPEQADGPKIPKLIWYPAVLVYGAPGSGKTYFAEQEVGKRLAVGHRVVVLDPHAAYGAWQGCEVYGGGMDYAAIDAKLAWFADEVAKRYKVVQSQPNPKFQPLTFVCDEFTRWGGKCPNSTDFFEQLVTDIRKVEMFGLIISHTRTLAGLANAKGFASLRDEALLEVEILGNKDEETGRATPRFEAKIKLPGQPLSDRTLVKLTKHPTLNKPEPTSQNNAAESTTDYLNRVFKLEFDLGKPETESEAVSDDFYPVKKPHSSESGDSNAVYFTPLKLDRARAIELILKLKNEMKHMQTEIIWMLWNARPGKTKAYETAVSEYKELLAEGEK